MLNSKNTMKTSPVSCSRPHEAKKKDIQRHKWKLRNSQRDACQCRCTSMYRVVIFFPLFLRVSTPTSATVNCELCCILSLGMDGTFSCVVVLEPLLLTQVLADMGNECQPNPDPGVAYIESVCKSWDRISCIFYPLLFYFSARFMRWQLNGVPFTECVRVSSWNRSLHIQVCASVPLLCLSVSIHVYVSCLWHLHVISHVTPLS